MVLCESRWHELSLEPDGAGVSALDASRPGARSLGDPLLHRFPPALRVLLQRPRRRATSLVGTLRPGRRSRNRAVAGTLVAALSRRRLRCSMFLAHRRQREAARRRGSQRDRSLTVSPGLEAFSAATLEIALVCDGPERTVARLSLAAISRAAAWGCFPFHLWRVAAWSRGECRRAGAAATLATRLGSPASRLYLLWWPP